MPNPRKTERPFLGDRVTYSVNNFFLIVIESIVSFYDTV